MSKKNTVHSYANKDITVRWDSAVCVHAAECVKNSPQVFTPKARPWINVDAAKVGEIVETIAKCPSGALTYELNSGESEHEEKASKSLAAGAPVEISIKRGGPLLVKGAFELNGVEGEAPMKKDRAAFCRCGESSNMPFCDGSHRTNDFDR